MIVYVITYSDFETSDRFEEVWEIESQAKVRAKELNLPYEDGYPDRPYRVSEHELISEKG